MRKHATRRVPQKRGGAVAFGAARIGVARSWPPHWEMHPAGEELLHVLAGRVDVELLVGRRVRCVALRAGEFAVVPRATWHRPLARGRVEMLHVTLGAGTEATFEDTPPPLAEKPRAKATRRRT
ncbi:MAG: cupin domain-containing protein [Deltaproteobacteria bacterium]|nr:cupin domain-containing protein [Deltaproteobacteria bacterium]